MSPNRVGKNLSSFARILYLPSEKRSGERNVENRFQVQLDKDGGVTTRQSWGWSRVGVATVRNKAQA